MTDRAALFFIDDLDLYRRIIKIMAATEGISIKVLTERLLRLGMVAPKLAEALADLADVADYKSMYECKGMYKHMTAAAIAAYDAALNGKETE